MSSKGNFSGVSQRGCDWPSVPLRRFRDECDLPILVRDRLVSAKLCLPGSCRRGIVPGRRFDQRLRSDRDSRVSFEAAPHRRTLER